MAPLAIRLLDLRRNVDKIIIPPRFEKFSRAHRQLKQIDSFDWLKSLDGLDDLTAIRIGTHLAILLEKQISDRLMYSVKY